MKGAVPPPGLEVEVRGQSSRWTWTLRIGARLRALREDHQLFLTDASERCGVSYSNLSEVERGLKTPTLPTLVALCEMYVLLVTEFQADMYPFGTLAPPHDEPTGT